MNHTERIRAISNEIEVIRAALRDKEEELKEAQLAEVKEVHGVYIGCVVTCKNKDYLVTSLQLFLGEPWAKGVARTKSGEWSKTECNLYSDWTLKEGKEAV